MKIIDAFIFYNELDLLKYRLELLNEYVDYFIIVESTKTFMYKDKPLLFNQNKSEFSKFSDKIIHIIVDDMPSNTNPWNNEAHQRNCIMRGIHRLNLTNDDVILISDVDEIVHPAFLHAVKYGNFTVNTCNLEMNFYYYNLHTLNKSKWWFPLALSYSSLLHHSSKQSLHDIRINKPFMRVRDCGWHLSYFGDINYIRNKIQTFSHQEFNTEDIVNDNNIKNSIIHGTDLFKRNGDIYELLNIDIKDNNNLPPKYDIYLSKYL